ncbi:hypothetical protein SMD44_08068 [Streptomyces alboflavus]|uniref:Uncharacterized protein n=1 Tax=Streptomyces alboflavus TaxID=67267 RepID=A0A1Z1WQ37_9ACTN|nr:hypothetical protein SMD44_08068 [Streptomyces alboflavus]
MRRLVSVTFCRRASGPVAASDWSSSPAIRAAKPTNCSAIRSESCCARRGLSAVPEILMMLPSEALALT